MWIWEAGAAPPAGPGSAMSVLTAIWFHVVTTLPAGSPRAGVERLPSTSTKATAAPIEMRIDFAAPLVAPVVARITYRLAFMFAPFRLSTRRLSPGREGENLSAGERHAVRFERMSMDPADELVFVLAAGLEPAVAME